MQFTSHNTTAFRFVLSIRLPTEAPAPPAAKGSAALSARALIANALSAAPASNAAGATVVGHDQRILRKGTGESVCVPDMGVAPNDTPMCLDASWRSRIDAWMKWKGTPYAHTKIPTSKRVK